MTKQRKTILAGAMSVVVVVFWFLFVLSCQESEQDLEQDLGLLSLPTEPSWSCNTYNSTDVPKTINGLITSTLSIDGTTGYIHYIEAILWVSHTNVSDLVAAVKSENSNWVLIWLFEDGDGDNIVDAHFYDGAVNDIEDAEASDAPFTGDWQPHDVFVPFHGLDADATNGTWTFGIEDTGSSGPGTLNAWSLLICMDASTPVPPTPTPSDTPIATDTPTVTPTPSGTPNPPGISCGSWVPEATNDVPCQFWNTPVPEAINVGIGWSYHHESSNDGGSPGNWGVLCLPRYGWAEYPSISVAWKGYGWAKDDDPDGWQGPYPYLSEMSVGGAFLPRCFSNGGIPYDFWSTSAGSDLEDDYPVCPKALSYNQDTFVPEVPHTWGLFVHGPSGNGLNGGGQWTDWTMTIVGCTGRVWSGTGTPDPPDPTPTTDAWVSEILPQPVPTGTPCPDWNLRGGCGQDDSFVEIGVSMPSTLALWSIDIKDSGGDSVCVYEFKSDNYSWPLKITWQDIMEDGLDGTCSSYPSTGTVYLYDDGDVLRDTRAYTVTMAGGNSWAAVNWADPEGTWAECTPSPGH